MLELPFDTRPKYNTALIQGLYYNNPFISLRGLQILGVSNPHVKKISATIVLQGKEEERRRTEAHVHTPS